MKMLVRIRSIMKLTVAVATVLIVTSPPLVKAVDSCEKARKLFESASKGKDTDEKILLLERTSALCETFSGYYSLGRLLLEKGNFYKANITLQKALSLAEGNWQKAITHGRIAELHLKTEEFIRANAHVEAARERLQEVKRLPPHWMIQVMRKLDNSTQTNGIVSSDTIFRSLNLETRSFVSKPRVNLLIHFDYDSAVLTEDGLQQVEALGVALETLNNGHVRFQLTGHTDAQGNLDYNQALSEKRAASIAQHLYVHHPSLKGHLMIEGVGESELRYPGNTEDDHRLNRRVEITVID